MNPYTSQLRLNWIPSYPVKIKLNSRAFSHVDDNDNTKWINLNQDSIAALREFLDDYEKRILPTQS